MWRLATDYDFSKPTNLLACYTTGNCPKIQVWGGSFEAIPPQLVQNDDGLRGWPCSGSMRPRYRSEISSKRTTFICVVKISKILNGKFSFVDPILGNWGKAGVRKLKKKNFSLIRPKGLKIRFGKIYLKKFFHFGKIKFLFSKDSFLL